MASELKVNKISPESGTTLTLGDSGDTINFGSGVLPNFENLTVTGDLTVDTNSLKVDSTNNFVGIGTATPSVALDVVGAITATGNITGTLATAAQPNITSLGTLTGLTTTGNINLGDNDKINLGATPTLELYSDGTNSWIKESGTGGLYIGGTNLNIMDSTFAEFLLTGVTNGAVTLFYDNNAKLTTTSTGIDVTGTVVSDGLNVSGSASTIATFQSSTTSVYQRLINSAASGGYIGYSNDDLSLWANASYKGFLLDGATNDISFYEDTGTTAKFFWDASTERLGIGTTSPTEKLHISTSGNSEINLQTTSSASRTQLFGVDNLGNNNYALGSINNTDTEFWNYKNGYMRFATNSAERMRIDSSGNVGIGTTSPSSLLNILGTTADADGALGSKNPQFVITGGNTNNPLEFGMDNSGATAVGFIQSRNTILGAQYLSLNPSGGNVGIGTSSPQTPLHVYRDSVGTANIRLENTESYIQIRADGDAGFIDANTHIFKNKDGSTERMRIDSSGNVLVGKTSSATSGTGAEFRQDGLGVFGRSGDYPLILNRTTSDGGIALFRKDGATVGSINAKDGDIAIGTNDTALRFSDSTASLYPFNNSTNAGRDNAIDLGLSSVKWKDGYFGGTVTATAFSGDGSGLTNVPAGMSLFNIVKVTATGTYTPTSGTKFVRVYCTGGGGGAGGWGTVDSTDSGRGSGGSGGNTGVKHYTATELGSSASISIGSGGSGGTGGSSPTGGSVGGNTTFNPAGTGATLTGYGGRGSYGFKQARSQLVDLSWNTSTGNADYIHFGELGIIAITNVARSGTTDYFASTAGGRSYFGVGGAGRIVTAGNGENGYSAPANSGGGGGGGVARDFTASPPAFNGGSGGSGVVVIEEYA